MDKDQIVAVLEEIAVLLELTGENPFKARAYSAAARALETIDEPIDKLIAEERLQAIKGIGDATGKKITELARTGRLPYYEELKASVPAGLMEMLQIPGLGPKKVKTLHDKLSLSTVAELESACKGGKVAGLSGFGEKTQTKILEGIAFRQAHASRHLLSDALSAAEPLLEFLRSHAKVIRCSSAGSLRRFRETIGDVDLLASSKVPSEVIESFVQQPSVITVQAKGGTKASVILQGGVQADLRVVSDTEYPFALAYFTGSKEHNIVMRQRAIERGLRLNEYGLFRAEEETRDPALRVPCATEEEIYRALDLAMIPPELREDHGELALAEKDELPRLLEWSDLRGSLHNHSNWSDGHGTLREIADQMSNLGLAYWAITDHSRSSFVANGLDAKRLREQLKAVAAVNAELADEGNAFRLLTGSEVDILSEGKLDFEDDLLAELDVVVASIHQGFSQDEAVTTKRLIRAAENPHVHTLGHLTGRLLLERAAYKVNQQAVIDVCAEQGTWIELNASPYRLDMDWRLWNYAKKKGVQCVINCDAHRFEHAGFLRLGAGVARKAGLTKENVINTLPLPKLMKLLKGP